MEIHVPPRGRWGLFLALLVVSAAHWTFVFGLPPRIPRDVADWPKEIRYYTVLQQAVTTPRVPWFVSRPIQETRKFLAIPETVLSPQIALLAATSIDTFFLLHVLLLHAVGTVGCLALGRRYGLSVPVVLLLWLLLTANGHITAHLAIGHSMWGGYFLLPFFFFLLLQLAEKTGPLPHWPIKVGLLLAAMLLQGSYHVFVWCVLFLALVWVFGCERRAVVLSLVWSAALGAVRLVPAALVFLGRREQAFESGYPTLGSVLAGLTVVRELTFPRQGGGAMGGLRWWEYDVYIGLPALVWLVAFGLRGLRESPPWRRLARPMAVMALLAYGRMYVPLNWLPVPLLGSQRVSSRLLVIPLGLLVAIAAIATERWVRGSARRRVAVALLALVTAGLLLGHSRAWTFARIAALSPQPPRPRDLAITIVDGAGDDVRDALYVASLRASATLSIGSLGLAVVHMRRRSRGGTPSASLPTERGGQ